VRCSDPIAEPFDPLARPKKPLANRFVALAATPRRRPAGVHVCFDAPPQRPEPRWTPLALSQFLDTLLARNRLSRTFPGSRVGARALTSDRQPLAMPKTPVAADITQPRDALLDLPAELTFDREVVVQQRRELG
jgi:hypothetical protein